MSMRMYDYIRQLHRRRALDANQRQRRPLPPSESTATTAPTLASIISAKSLHQAARQRMAEGHRAAGPDRILLEDLSDSDLWTICRQLSDLVLPEQFKPSTARRVPIPKKPSGTRTITIRSVAYAIVSLGVHHGLRDFLETIYLPNNFGFRRQLSTWDFFLALEASLVAGNQRIIYENDILKAFDFVPITPTMEIFARHITDEPLLRLIDILLRGHVDERREVGIDQGSAISTHALNLPLTVTLDEPFNGSLNPLLLRYVDNLAGPVTSVHEGLELHDRIEARLATLGMRLKHQDARRQIIDLSEGRTLLGLKLTWEADRIRYRVEEEAWQHLQEGLLQAYEYEHPKREAETRLRGWMEALAPAFERYSEQQLQRSTDVLREARFLEVSEDTIRSWISSARDRWLRLRRNRGLVVS